MPVGEVMSKHTPGPWIYTPNIDGYFEISQSGCYQFYVSLTVGGLEVGEEEANARLIAAAPELLGFAEAYIEQFCGYQITNTLDAKHDATGYLCDIARAAIAKAKGE